MVIYHTQTTQPCNVASMLVKNTNVEANKCDAHSRVGHIYHDKRNCDNIYLKITKTCTDNKMPRFFPPSFNVKKNERSLLLHPRCSNKFVQRAANDQNKYSKQTW